jgi:twitching motility protein PilT
MTEETLHMLLAASIKYGASDIHLKVGDPPMYRVNGQLAPLKYEKLKASDTWELCQHLVRDPVAREKLGEIQEYDASYSLSGVARFRVNIYRQRGSLSIIMRVIPSNIPTVEELGLPPILKKIAEYERGLVLVTGATGSGKTSTLAAMIRLINASRRCHILTIEDPIEFIHSGQMASISQRELGIDTRNFNVALRAALRQDPDVILVGEMRDPESIDIALKAGETGHMVFSTVHTTDAAKTINRLVSVFPAEEQQTIRYRIADSLKATISQRLLAKADGKGRVVAAEIMVVTKTVQEYIRNADQTSGVKDVIEKGRSQYGMQTFDQHLTDLYRSGVITLETAIEAASNPSDFQRALHFQ